MKDLNHQLPGLILARHLTDRGRKLRTNGVHHQAASARSVHSQRQSCGKDCNRGVNDRSRRTAQNRRRHRSGVRGTATDAALWGPL